MYNAGQKMKGKWSALRRRDRGKKKSTARSVNIHEEIRNQYTSGVVNEPQIHCGETSE